MTRSTVSNMTYNYRGTANFVTFVMSIFAVLVLLSAVDGFLIPHRKDEVPDDLMAQQLSGLSSGRLPDVKKGKKGIAVSQTNVYVDDGSPDRRPVFAYSSSVWPQNAGGKCNTTEEKVDCASYGVEMGECLARGCCYSEIRDGPSPWCYLPESSLVSQCRGREETRPQCGYYNIKRDECEGLGCCWRPTSTPGIPWCYHADPRKDTSPSPLPAPVLCGIPTIEPNVNLRIVGGVEAVPHSWPWTVSLQKDGDSKCGGSLISDQWVVSAAHCYPIFTDLSRSSVVVGAHSLDSPDPAYTKRIDVEKIVINEKYLQQDAETGASNDVMLIKLARPVTFDNAVRPVCLPKPFQAVEKGTRCWSTGWGTTTAGADFGSNVLNQVQLPLIDNAECNQPEWYNGEIDDTMVCAGYQEGGKDSCQGDSGGPLVCNDEDGRWFLYGIVSWGAGCGNANKPGLYARTSAYLKWISKEIKANSG